MIGCTVLHSDMFRIQTIHLKIGAFKLTTGPFFMNMLVPGTKTLKRTEVTLVTKYVLILKTHKPLPIHYNLNSKINFKDIRNDAST